LPGIVGCRSATGRDDGDPRSRRCGPQARALRCSGSPAPRAAPSYAASPRRPRACERYRQGRGPGQAPFRTAASTRAGRPPVVMDANQPAGFAGRMATHVGELTDWSTTHIDGFSDDRMGYWDVHGYRIGLRFVASEPRSRRVLGLAAWAPVWAGPSSRPRRSLRVPSVPPPVGRRLTPAMQVRSLHPSARLTRRSTSTQGVTSMPVFENAPRVVLRPHSAPASSPNGANRDCHS